MKKFLQFLLVIPLFFSLIPINSAFAFTEGYATKTNPFVYNHSTELKVGDALKITWSSTGTFNNGRIIVNGYNLTKYSSTSNTVISDVLSITEPMLLNTPSLNSEIIIEPFGSHAATIKKIELNGVELESYEDVTPPLNVTNLQSLKNITDIYGISFSSSESADIDHYKIYVNDVFKTNISNTSYYDLIFNLGDVVKVTSIDSAGNESSGTSVVIQDPDTLPPSEVTNITYEPSFDSVKVNFDLPKDDDFSKVNVYLDGVLYGSSIGGTYVIKNLDPLTTYSIKLTTVDLKDNESEGVAQEIKTSDTPPPVISGEDFTEKENGDYLVTWEEPTTGKVKVFVGGKEYSSVSASEKQFLIPSNDMKYTALGEPDIKIQAIAEDGKTSDIIETPKLDGLESPFSITDLIKTGNGLLWYIGPLVLLGLSFLLIPKLRNLLFNAFKSKEGKGEQKTRRFSNGGTRTRERQEKHQGKAYLSQMERIEKETKDVKVREARAREEKIINEKLLTDPIKESKASPNSFTKREPRTPRVREGKTPREPRERNRRVREPRIKRRG